MNTEKYQFDLSKIITQHPGGYPDIMATLERYSDHLVIWSTFTSELDPQNPRERKIVEEKHEISYADILTAIHETIKDTRTSGLIAGQIQSILTKYGLPVIGNDMWLQPAEMWSV